MADIKIFVGSVFGNASEVADLVTDALIADGHSAEQYSSPGVAQLQQASAILVITSTTGQGDIPLNLEDFYLQLHRQIPLITNTPFAVIALGDSGYGDTFCGGGRQMQQILLKLQGRETKEMLSIDSCETLEPELEAVPWAQSWAREL